MHQNYELLLSVGVSNVSVSVGVTVGLATLRAPHLLYMFY